MKQPLQTNLVLVVRHPPGEVVKTLAAIVCDYDIETKVATLFVMDHLAGKTYFSKTTQGYEDGQFCYSGEYGL